MRKILISATLAGLLVAACGDDSSTGGGGNNTGGGGENTGAGGTSTGGAPTGGAPTGGGGEQPGGGGTGGMPMVVCGDGSIEAGEDCDDSNTANGDGCSANCGVESGFTCIGEPSDCSSECGDGLVASDEDCDDDDTDAGDGCSDTCTVENGWSCMGEPSVCMTGCGDGIVAGTETCDDMNAVADDGCTSCAVDVGFVCNGMPSVCELAGSCANPIVASNGFAFQVADPSLYGDDLTLTDASCVESTDMGPKPDLVFSVALAAGDTLQVADSGSVDTIMHVTQACSNMEVCLESFDGFPQANEIDPGLVFRATAAGTYTVIVDSWSFAPTEDLDLLFTISPCGDGAIGPGEVCDDSDAMGGDGCSATCEIEPGYACTGEPSVCTLLCGNGTIDAGEQCDDSDAMGGDGCSASCQVEPGFLCNGVPSVCSPIPAATCAAPIVASDGFVLSGTNFGAFGDDLDFPDATCADVAGATFDSADAVFSINLTAGQRMRIRNNAAQPDLDTVIQALGTTCAGSIACLGEFDDPEATGLSYVAATSGTHYFVVEAYSAMAPAGDNFSIQFDVATCGDGVIELGEPCDDANINPNDGCSATCNVEPGFMCMGTPSVCTGTPAANCANPILVTSNAFTYAGADIKAFGDTENYNAGTGCLDVSTTPPSGFDIVFRVDAAAGENIRVRELGALDAVFHIFTQPTCGAGVACAASADAGETTGITYTAPAAGPVFIAVESWGNPMGAAAAFDIRIDRSICGNGTVEGSETCDDGNTTPGDGCSATCQTQAGFICEGAPSTCFNVSACGNDILCYLGPCAGGTIVQGSAMGLPVAIPDNQPMGGANLTIPVAATGTVRRMAMRFTATHTWVEDVDVFLTPPGGMPLDVCTDNGGSGDNFGNMTQGTFFRDGAGASIVGATAPFAGVFRPEQPFSTFTNTSVNGNWSLRVADDTSTDTGSVTGWDLAFCVNP
jgi:cysteine-rich repeat protein